MESNPLRARGAALENAYMRQIEAQRLRRHRDRGAHERIRVEMAAELDVDDDGLVDRLIELGITPDTVAAFERCIDAELAGPVNLVAPNPVTNREFAKALGAQLGRPSFFPAPKFAVDIRLGKELASTMAYGSLRVLPTVLEADGFSFSAPTIEAALAHVFA